MTGDVLVANGRTVLVCGGGPPLYSAQEALDVIGQAWGHEADMVAIPVALLPARFFTLSSGLAGDVLQKFVNYRMPVAIIGSIDAQLRVSSALRAFVSESNDGQQVWFLDSIDELKQRLANG